MNNPLRILHILDQHLSAPAEMTLFGRAALALGYAGSANLTVEQVLRRRSEFLTIHRLNVISVRAEAGVVAIAIARPSRRVLHLREVWSLETVEPRMFNRKP